MTEKDIRITENRKVKQSKETRRQDNVESNDRTQENHTAA